MPIFDNEINDQGTKLSNIQLPNVDLRSAFAQEVNPNLGTGDPFGLNQNNRHGGISWEEMGNISAPAQTGFDRPFASVSGSTLLENRRYPMYQRDVNLENINALNQPWYKQVGNGIVKAGVNFVGTFGETMMTIPDTLSGDLTGKNNTLEVAIGNWKKNMEDVFPNYISTYEKEHPFKAIVGGGFANFLGNDIIKNLGTIGGFVAGAAVQDLAVGAGLTAIGKIPGVANNIGKIALNLNKTFVAVNDLEKVLTPLERATVLSGEQLSNVEKIAQLAAASKIKDGFKYALAQYGAARTMGATDARDTHDQLYNQLVDEYKLRNGGNEPSGKDLSEIEDYATNAMNTRFGIDMALLLASGSIQFDNLFKSFGKASKSLTSGVTQEFEGLGKIGLKEGSIDVAEAKVPKGVTGKIWENVRPKLPNIFAESVITMGGLYAGGKGVENYYTNKYRDLHNPNNKKTFDELNEVLNSTGYALQQQFGTSEGQQAMFTGALLGLATSAIHSGIDKARGMSREQRLQDAVNTINNHPLTSILQDRYNDTLDSINIAKGMQDSVKENNIFKYKNLQHDNLFNLVMSRLRLGMHDFTVEQLGMLKELPKEEFENRFGMEFSESNKKTVSEYVDKLIEHANEIKKSYDAISNTFRNPYEYFVKEDTDAKVESNRKYNQFEEWKKDLTYYSSRSVDTNDRIESIQQKLYDIHPDLNNNVVARLVNPIALKKLAQSYEEKAKLLNGTIIDDMTADEKKAIKDQVKALRTFSEKINSSIDGKNMDVKTFHELLNFELNGQDRTQDNVVGFEHAANLYQYGYDLNQLGNLKKTASDAVDALTGKEGFENYFRQKDEMNKDTSVNPDDFEAQGGLGGGGPVPPSPEPTTPSFTNKEGNVEPFEVGRQYSTEKFNEPKITKIDEDRWQVSVPNGATTFHSSEEKAQAKVNEIKQDYADLSTVKVIGFNEDGSIKVEDVNGDIQNIPAEAFGGYEKVETRQEKLIKYAAEVGKVQDELEKNSGDIATNSDEEDIATMAQVSFEDKKKDAMTDLFLGTTTESEEEKWSGVSESSPHIVRSREFLNTAADLPNRGDLQAILVHYGNEEALGLSGLAKLSYGEFFPKDINEVTNVNGGFLAQVYMTKDGYYIDKTGNKIGKVGEPVDLEKVVFQTMPTTSLTRYSPKIKKDYNLHRSNQAAEAEAAQKQYIALRKAIFADKSASPVYSDFTVSRGIGVELEDGKQRNNVTETLLPADEKVAERLINTQKGLITISKDGRIQHNGQSVKIPKGRPVFKYGDTAVALNNAKLTPERVDAIFEIFKKVSDNMKTFSKVAPELEFLQNVVFYKRGGKTRTANQVSIDEKTMTLNIGTDSFDISDVANNEKAIKEKLSNIYTNINSVSLEKNFSNKFREFYIKDGELTSNVWDNYQTYLLSSKYPDGSPRPESDIPLKTSIAKRTAENPVNFKQRYSTIIPTNLPFKTEAPATKVTETPDEKQQAATELEKQANGAIMGYVNKAVADDRAGASTFSYDNETPNTYSLPGNLGDVEFFVDKDGKVELADTDKVTAARNTIVAKLEAIANKPAAAPTPVPEVDPEAEKSKKLWEIQRRRNKETGGTKALRFANVGDILYSKEGKKYEVLSKKDKYGRSLEYKLTYPDGTTVESSINPKTASEYNDERFAVVDLYYKPYSEIEKINAKYDAEVAALEGGKPVEEPKEELGLVATINKSIANVIGSKVKPIDYSTDQPGKWVNGEFMPDNLGGEFGRWFSEKVGEYLKGGKIDKAEASKIFKEYAKEVHPDKHQSQEAQLVADSFFKAMTIVKDKGQVKLLNDLKSEYDKIMSSLNIDKTDPNKFKGTAPKDEYKRVGVDTDTSKISEADLAILKRWHAENVPGIPYEILENIITTHDGEKAFGVFQDGVAKFYKGATKGTEYHELFHGIFNGFLSEDQREALKEEFKQQTGSFTDRATGKTINYADATDKQFEEKLADDFGDFRKGKMAAKSFGQKVLDFFKSIIEFFKSFGTKSSLKDKLFNDINTGKFKEAKLKDIANPEPMYKQVEGITPKQTHEFVQDMTLRARNILFNENKESIYNPAKMTSNELFRQIEAAYITEGKRERMSDTAWGELVQKTKESLRTTLGLKFNEDAVADLNAEDANTKEYDRDPFSMGRNDASPAIKIGLMLPMTSNKPTLGRLPKRQMSSVDGYKILPYVQAFSTIMDKLSNTSDVDLAMQKLGELAKNDPNYVRPFADLGGNPNDFTFSQDNIKNPADWRYFVDFYQTFTKMRPDVVAQYTNGNEVYLGAANLYTAAKGIQRGWLQNMRDLAKKPGSLIVFDSETKKYGADPKVFANTPIGNDVAKLNFLNQLGVNVTPEMFAKFNDEEQDEVMNQASKIYEYLQDKKELVSLTDGTLDVKGRFATIAEIVAKTTNPLQDGVYTGVDGKTRQSNTQNNALSLLVNRFNESSSLDALKENRTELNDVFSTHSLTLQKGGQFFDKEGVKIPGKELKVELISGDLDELKDRGRGITKLALGKRLAAETNQNVNGSFYALNPGDSASEWKMNLGVNVPFKDVQGGIESDIHNIFKGYLLDDVALALDYKERQKLANVGKKAKELRFFKDILSGDTLKAIDNMIATGKDYETISKYITDNISKINTDVTKYLNNSADLLKDALMKNEQIKLAPTKKEGSDEVFYTFKGLVNEFAKEAGIDKFMLSEQDVNDLVKFIDTNKTIANIEFHKILFGDPYQFKVKVEDGKTIFDQTKRVKSFDSPAATTFNSDAFNNWHNIEYNKTGLYGQEGRIVLDKGTPGYDEFKDYMSTVTTNDMDIIGRVMGKSTENDASSILMDRAYRQVKLRNADWGNDAEANFQWNMAYTRRALDARKDVEWTYGDNTALKAHDEALLATPEPKFIREVLKPIVRGSKYGSDKIDIVLDKDSQMPLYYKDVEHTALGDLYVKMLQEGNKDYIIAKSGRKLGIEGIHELYVDGKFNTAPFAENTIVNVPWSAYGIQVENNYDAKGGKVTSSVQVPKIINLDLFANGKPVTTDPKRATAIQAEYDRGVRIKNALNQNGYDGLLNMLGMDKDFNVVNRQALADSLNHEILRTAVSENVKDAITLDNNGNFIIPFESTFSYKKIKDVIYSMLDKSINHAKTNGGAYVQAPVTGWEDAAKGRRVVEINGKKVLTDDTLHFPTKEDPYMEVMLPHWFGEKIRNNKRFDTDEKILNYLNSTEEGQEILKGVAFRIPCTGVNSIDSIRVKRFLSQAMGKTVVVPSELTVKAGSDFDVDKLTTYLKNVYIDKNNDIKLVRYQGSEEATKEFFGNVFDQILQSKKVKKAELLEAAQVRAYGLEDTNKMEQRYGALLDVLLKDVEDPASFEDTIMTQLENLGDADIQAKLKADYINEHYRASLENEYYDHLEKMINLPEVYDQRITPVDDAGLAKFADKIDDLENNKDEDIKNRMINGTYLTEQRHAFAMAKAWIGIVASNIAAHSVAQKGNVILDTARFDNIDPADLKYLGDGKINIPHNTVEIDGVTYATLSGVTTTNKSTNISTRLSGHGSAVVDVVKDPFILKIINSNLAPTVAMFLERIGSGETGLLLMKQPIVKEFLTRLDNRGATSLYNQSDIEDAFSRFQTTENALLSADTLNIDKLEENIRKYNREGLTPKENAEQHLILNEFLKYAKMADYMSDINQALTYDTAKFGNGEALSKKQYRTQRALKNNIFGGVQELLDNTFLGEQARFLDDGVNAIGEVLKLESRDFANITNQVLAPYMQNKYLRADDFNAIGNKIKMSFLDYIIQIKGNINDDIKSLIADTQTSIASQLAKAKEEYPSMEILKTLESTPAIREGGPRSVALKINLRNDPATEDIFIGYMRELRDNVGTNELYNNLVKVAILQGMYKSPISIGNIIPVEDYAKSITPIINGLRVDSELEAYKKGWFQRNNFRDPSVFTKIEPKFKVGAWSGPSWDPQSVPTSYYSTQYFPNIQTYDIASTDRKILTLNEKYNYLGTRSDYVQFARAIEVTRGGKPTGEIIDAQTGKPITKNQLRLMKEKGDTSFKDLYNYQRVRNADGSPFYIYDNGEKLHVYKLINVYGDGNLVHEYYPDFRPSPFKNGTIQVNEELTDDQVRNALSFKADTNDKPVLTVKTQPVQKTEAQPVIDSSKKINIYAGTGENAELSNFANRSFTDKDGVRFNTVEGAFQAAKLYSSPFYFFPDFGGPRDSFFEMQEKFQNATGAEAKALGRQIKGLDTKKWDSESSIIMKDLLKASFEQNPEALAKLLATGNAELTHTQDKGKWGKEFPKLLMEVRSELSGQPIATQPVEKSGRSILEARQTPIDYTPGQTKALQQIGQLIDKNEQGYYLLAGYAGTGKTTIAENIANYAQENGRQVHILAPTNKAAKVLNDKLKAAGVSTSAATIHRAIYGEPDVDTGEWIPKTNLKDSVILVDESSMISKEVMSDLLANSKNNNIIVFMGDSFQLEPVGDDSKLFQGGVSQVANSQSQLTEVKRQSLDSNILKVATLVRNDNKGYVPEQSMDDFKISKSKSEFIKDFREAIKNNENAVAIVATNNERLIMNDAARMEKFGPDRKILNDGEVLIAVANSSDIPNSEIFKATTINGEPEKHVLTFDFKGKQATYNMYLANVVGEDGKTRKVMHFPALDRPSLYHSEILTAVRNSNPALFSKLDDGGNIIHTKKGKKLSPSIVISTYGYAVTAHKSQGSQWDKVFVNQNYNAPTWNPARWYYTAITRSAKDLIVLPSTNNITIKNADIESKINSIVPEENDITSQIENEKGLNTKDFKC